MFRKKNKHIRQLTVGLRTQLCKECHDFQARLCEVDGKPCMFHRWVDEDTPLLRTAEVIRKTYALVEYPDGSVGKVDPSLVTFLDKEVK